MDDTDHALLAELRRDARLPISDLAARLGVSRATIRARIERLQTAGTIRGFTVITRESETGDAVRGLTMLSIEGAGMARLVHRLRGLPEVRRIHSTNGKWDLIVELGTGSLPEFDRVLSRIREMPGVTASETSLLLSTTAP